MVILYSVIRTLDKFLIKEFFGFNGSIIYTLLMFSSEGLTGLIILKYQSKYLKEKKTAILNNTRMSIYLAEEEKKAKNIKQIIKIYGLLFLATFFDFIEFTISVVHIKKYIDISISLEFRFFGVLAISNVLIYVYILKTPIGKHQKLSIIIISTCFMLAIINEFYFQKISELFTYVDFIGALTLIFIKYFFLSLMDSIDQYLLKFESFDQFKIIIAEGGFGTILTLLYFFVENPMNSLKNVYISSSSSSFVLFIFMLFFYFVISGIRNAFRIMTNKMYSPMVLTLSDNLINPVYVIFNYIYKNDFNTGNGQNVLYFTISLILSIITTLSTFIYNEFIVLFCCGLEHDTHYQISRRATFESIEMIKGKLCGEILDNSSASEKEEIYNIYV